MEKDRYYSEGKHGEAFRKKLEGIYERLKGSNQKGLFAALVFIITLIIGLASKTMSSAIFLAVRTVMMFNSLYYTVSSI